jgi:hypothetical protein
MAGNFPSSSTLRVRAMNWHLHCSRAATQLPSCSPSVARLSLTILASVMRILECLRYNSLYLFIYDSHLLTNAQIFPISLQSLLSLSNEIQQFSIESNGLRTCHGCSKKSPSLQRCARCSLFWYCTKVRPQSISPREIVDIDTDMIAARIARSLHGPKRATRTTASTFGIPTCVVCLLSSGTSLTVAFDFLSMPHGNYKVLQVSIATTTPRLV